MPKLYLANPLGFMELSNLGLEHLINILKPYFTVIEPFRAHEELGNQIASQTSNFFSGKSSLTYFEVKKKISQLNTQIGKRNEGSIRECDYLLAILDGSDVDSGVSSEIGFAYGLGKQIFGFRGDIRQTGDNLATDINLQVQYFLEARGGKIFTSLNELQDWVSSLKG